MSWDLYLVPREHAEDPGEWLESIAESPADAAAARAQAEAVHALQPELEVGPEDEDGAVELWTPEESGLPVQVWLDGRHAAINVAYWDLGDRTAELADLVHEIAATLAAATGWAIYDPQEDRVLGLDELRDAFAAGHAEGVAHVKQIVAETERPRRRRFLGLFRAGRG